MHLQVAGAVPDRLQLDPEAGGVPPELLQGGLAARAGGGKGSTAALHRPGANQVVDAGLRAPAATRQGQSGLTGQCLSRKQHGVCISAN